MTADEFCDAAAKIGETNYAKCSDAEKSIVPCPSGMRPIDVVKDECSNRVHSAKVEFHGDAAARCIDAAKKRGGKTTFCSFNEVSACSGVLSGKATDGQPALFPEECAKGFVFNANHCVKPVAKNAPCSGDGAGLLGVEADHPMCEEGLDCFMTKSPADGLPGAAACMPPSDVGAACQLDVNTCKSGSSCYQGKCRARSAAQGECMSDRDCERGLGCDLKGGGNVGKCVETPLETCH